MSHPASEPGLDQLAELIRLTALPAGQSEVCRQGADAAARALPGAKVVILMATESGALEVAGASSVDLSASESERGLRVAGQALARSQTVEDPPGASPPAVVALPLPGPSGALGALVIHPVVWTEAARSFARCAAIALASSIGATRAVRQGRLQGELLARRNVELETVRELAAKLQEMSDEREMLQAALDLVLRNLGLEAGWIFWGDQTEGELELAAARGVAEEFLCDAREHGIGGCLCRDVFISGRLMVARNTLDCPRLPKIVRTTSHACVPLKFERGTLGVLNIANRPGQLLTDDELAFLETVARQISIAVDKARTTRAEERRHAEAREALLRLQQAQLGMLRAERLAAVGTLASSLAHEVRNPLNSVNLQLVLLTRRVARLEEALQGEMPALIDAARKELARLDTLVEEFLSLSSLDRLALADADANAVVRELVALMTESARERGIRIEQDLDPAVPVLRMDREKIKQVLINLVRNGIEAMAPGGKLVLSTRGQDGGLVIRVADTGTGIEPGLDVFDFFTTTKPGGTGLGLAISRRIVEAHGGSLTYTSERGRGTVFSIALRRERPDPEVDR